MQIALSRFELGSPYPFPTIIIIIQPALSGIYRRGLSTATISNVGHLPANGGACNFLDGACLIDQVNGIYASFIFCKILNIQELNFTGVGV